MGLVGAAVVIALGFGVYGVGGPRSPLLFAVTFAVSGLAFAAVGFALGAVMSSTRAAQGVGLTPGASGCGSRPG